MYYRLTRNLKTHLDSNGKILCMPNTTDNYLYPHLTTVAGGVSCGKCIKVLLSQDKNQCPFRETASHEPDSCTITKTPCDIFDENSCLTLEGELDHK